MKTIDGHIHIAKQFDIDKFSNFVLSKTDKANIIACSHSKCIALLPLAFKMKEKYPDKYYVFAAPDLSSYYLHQDDLGNYLAKDCINMIKMGVDGIKLLEGKPQMRKKYPIPNFDDEILEPFWKEMEQKQVPILMHINDPDNFWDKDNAPSFAISQGWLYDETYPNNEDQYKQILNVLDRHPKLKISFAHFMFFSNQLERLSTILDKYLNVSVDLTPGIEMYENFSNNIDEAKCFFNKYHNRIMYGTDIGGRCVLMGENKAFDEIENSIRPLIVHYFLQGDKDKLITSDGHYLIDRKEFVMKPLNLNKRYLEDILANNFERFVSINPREINKDLFNEYKVELKKRLDAMNNIKGFDVDYSVLD